jgi:hypothetical protein
MSAVTLWRLRVLCFILLGACGRVGFDSTRDASDDDAVQADARMPCTGPFGAPKLVGNVNSTANDWGGHLTEDHLELYFGSDRAGGTGTDIYVATRASRTDEFGTPVRIDQLATPTPDDNPFVTADGLTMWFDSGNEIKFATRATTSDVWGPAVDVPSVSSVSEDVAPALSADELTLYLGSTRVGTMGGYDVWMSKRASKAEAFPAPIDLGGAINTPGFDCCAWIPASGAELWFTATPLANEIQVIGRDLITGMTSGTPTTNSLFDSMGNDVDVFGTLDGEVIGFASDRPGGLGAFDLYVVERSCP